jgi:protein phosphatase
MEAEFLKDRFHYEAQTDVGIKRSHNQDAHGISTARSESAWQSRGHLFLVADGMGAHAVGEMASKLAVDTIQLVYHKSRDADPPAALAEAFQEANQIIHERGKQNPEFKGMGTTATALAILPDGAHLAHVGDTRCYRIRGAVIEQLSFDHSLQWELARRRNINPAELTAVPSHVIIRSLGPQERVVVDQAGPYDVREGDRFLLCSDGLTGTVMDKEIWAVVTHLAPNDACRFLIDLANLRGGMDNVTVVLVQVGEPAGDPNTTTDEESGIRPAWERFHGQLRRIPFPGWLVLTGISMATIGYLWRDFSPSLYPSTIAIVAVLAIAFLGAGLAGFVYRRRRQREEASVAGPDSAPVYRRVVCALDPVLVENLARAEQSLRELAIEESWRVDWTQLHRTRAEAAKQQKAGRLVDAFREYCRCVSILSAALPKYREKQEVFRPNWEGRA